MTHPRHPYAPARRWGIAALLVAAFMVATPAARATNDTPYSGTVAVDTGKPFLPFVDAFAAALKADGFNLVGVACADCAIKAAFGETVAGNRVFLFFRPDLARRMLAASVAAGIEAPIQVYVTETPAGGALVTYRRPSHVFGAYDRPELLTLGRELDTAIELIVATAAAES